MVKKIESSSNPFIKEIKKLKDKKERYRQKKYIAEGLNVCLEIINNKPQLVEYIITDREELKEFENFNVILVPEFILESLCEVKTPQGVLAVVKFNNEVKPFENADLFVYLDDVRDPGNLGTIIRTADACGANGVILSPECADIYNSKTVRSTMGSMFHIDIFYENEHLKTVRELKEKGFEIIAGSLDTDEDFYDVDLRKKAVICLGNEAHGISKELEELSRKVKIPIVGKAESLNVAAAGAVMMFECVRQRRK